MTESYAYQEVTCTRCGRTYLCTPRDDFYLPAENLDWDQGGICHGCLLELAGIPTARTEVVLLAAEPLGGPIPGVTGDLPDDGNWKGGPIG